jgi:hypothetical protein
VGYDAVEKSFRGMERFLGEAFRRRAIAAATASSAELRHGHLSVVAEHVVPAVQTPPEQHSCPLAPHATQMFAELHVSGSPH